MAVRKILLHNENGVPLRKKSSTVKVFDKRTNNLIRDLLDTLKASSDGVGLAAPQINNHQRIIAVCLRGENQEDTGIIEPTVLINPEIIDATDELKDFDGCLSFPGLYGETYRPHYLHIVGLDKYGEPFDSVYDGFDAVVIHHEIDHLEGVLFVDRIENLSDLYRVSKNESGELVRLPVKDFEPIKYRGRI